MPGKLRRRAIGLTSVAVGDFDQDGRAGSRHGELGVSDDVTVLLGHGDGTFAAAVSYSRGRFFCFRRGG